MTDSDIDTDGQLISVPLESESLNFIYTANATVIYNMCIWCFSFKYLCVHYVFMRVSLQYLPLLVCLNA